MSCGKKHNDLEFLLIASSCLTKNPNKRILQPINKSSRALHRLGLVKPRMPLFCWVQPLWMFVNHTAEKIISNGSSPMTKGKQIEFAEEWEGETISRHEKVLLIFEEQTKHKLDITKLIY